MAYNLYLKQENNIKELPIYKINRKYYYLDKRLNEFRNIKNFNDSIKYENVNLKDLQKINKSDTKKIYGI